jgi:hypothetical protein
MPIAITIISSLISGLIGVGISTWYYRRYEKRKQKFEVLKKIVGYRFALTQNTTNEAKVAFFSALNVVVILYHDNPKVITALHNLHRELNIPNRLDDNLVSLFKAMCKDLNIKDAGLNDEFFLRPFTPTAGF